MEAGPKGRISVYVDGASRGNPGPAGIGVMITSDSKKVIKKFQKFVGNLTNNVAEYMALIHGLQEAILLGYDRITLYTDSELVAKQISREYKVKDKELKLFYSIATHLIENLPELEVKYIDREDNKDADKLANEAIDVLF